MAELSDITASPDIDEILESSRVIAVLGASDRSDRPAHYVPRYLHEQGYRVIPVNPALSGDQLFDEEVRSTLAEIEGPVEIVDVFRRPADIPQHLPDILAMDPLPRVVWFQLGIRNDEAADELGKHGIAVVQDRCLLAEHQLRARRRP